MKKINSIEKINKSVIEREGERDEAVDCECSAGEQSEQISVDRCLRCTPTDNRLCHCIKHLVQVYAVKVHMQNGPEVCNKKSFPLHYHEF